MITNSDLALIPCEALAALAATDVDVAAAPAAPAAPAPDDDVRDEVPRDAM